MEDRDEKAGSDPEVEAHRPIKLPAGPKAADEASDEAAGEDEPDVELHRAKRSQK